jgi:hypothetical protein
MPNHLKKQPPNMSHSDDLQSVDTRQKPSQNPKQKKPASSFFKHAKRIDKKNYQRKRGKIITPPK